MVGLPQGPIDVQTPSAAAFTQGFQYREGLLTTADATRYTYRSCKCSEWGNVTFTVFKSWRLVPSTGAVHSSSHILGTLGCKYGSGQAAQVELRGDWGQPHLSYQTETL